MVTDIFKRLTENTRESVRLSGGGVAFFLRVFIAAIIGCSVWQPHGAPYLALAAIWVILPAGGGPRRAEAGAVVLLAYYLASAAPIAEALAGYLQEPLAIGWVYGGCWALAMASPWLVIGTVNRFHFRRLARALRIKVRAPLPGLDHPPGPARSALADLLRWSAYLALLTVPPLGAFALMPLSAEAISAAQLFANASHRPVLEFALANLTLMGAAGGLRLAIAYSEEYVGLCAQRLLGAVLDEQIMPAFELIEFTRMPLAFLSVATVIFMLLMPSLGSGAGTVNRSAHAGAVAVTHAGAAGKTGPESTPVSGPTRSKYSGSPDQESVNTYAATRSRHSGPSGLPRILGLETRTPAGVDQAMHAFRAGGAMLKSMRLVLAYKEALRRHPGLRLIASPEFSAGNRCRYPKSELPIYRFWAHHPRLTLVIGARIALPHHPGACTDGAIILSRAGMATIEAGQPAPLSEWRPWSGKAGFPAHWWRHTVSEIPGFGRVATLICYDGAIAWFPLIDASAHPNLMVSLQGHRWHWGGRVAAIQHRLVRGWARLYHIPVVVSDARLGPDSLIAGTKKGAPRKTVMPLAGPRGS